MAGPKRKINQRNKVSRENREAKGLFFCFCTEEQNVLHGGIISHARIHTVKVYSICPNSWCIFPTFTKAKRGHICWSTDDVIAASMLNDPQGCRGKKKKKLQKASAH